MTKTISKRFVIDTNVLIHDPACLSKFEDNEIYVLTEVMAELDKFKTEDSPRGRSARKANHAIASIFATGEVSKGCRTRSGGTLKTLLLRSDDGPKTRAALPEDIVDHRLIRAVEQLDSTPGGAVVLITKDNNLRIKAQALGFTAEDYQNDKVIINDKPLAVIDLNESQWRKLKQDKVLRLPDIEKMGVKINEWIEVRTQDNEAWVLCIDANTVRLPNSPDFLDIPGGTTYRPRHEEQRLFVLMDDKVPLITGEGMAGTGKTMTTLAVALFETLRLKKYDKIIVSRPVIGMGNQDIGFLPGSLEEKMDPWMQGYYDNLEQLLTPRDTRHDRKKGANHHQNRQQPKAPPGVNGQPRISPVKLLMESGRIEIQPLHTIRGRSLRNAFVIVDESQNTKPGDMKTIITRMGEGSKLVLLGDASQIDDPFLDSYSNGIAYVRDRLKNQRLCAHVTLSQVQRSELAELAATKL